MPALSPRCCIACAQAIYPPRRKRRGAISTASLFYDCPPVLKKAHLPISRRAIDFSKTATALFRLQLHGEIRRLRKTAPRRGHLAEDSGGALRPERLKALLKGDIAVTALSDDDFFYDVKQKGVDIASLAFKKQVDQIVLIAGDADFVPAAKLARREGIDFVLDPMWHPIHPSLNGHIDGLRSTCPNPARPRGDTVPPDDLDPDLP